MAAPTTDIPLASIPRLADTASLLSLPFGSAFLMLLLGLDAWRSKSKKAHWIPGDSLVLGALSLQLLGLVSRPFVNISDSQKLNRESVKEISELILSNMFVALSGRAVMCVFMGNMVANVARSHDRNVWSDMVALAISATSVLIHLFYEVYIIIVHWIQNPFPWNYLTLLYLVIHIIILASIVLLVLLLGCAAFASKSVHEVVAQRIPVLLSRSEHRNTGSVIWWEAVEEHAVRSWITARTHQSQYIIARSVLISSIGFLVTICVVFCLGFSIWGWTKIRGIVTLVDDGFDWLRVIVVVVQWIFILPGWAIVCWRWLTAVVFYPRRMGSEAFNLKQFFRVEDFWTRAMHELQEYFKEMDVESIKISSSFLDTFLFMFIQKLRLYRLLPVLRLLQELLVVMSKICWLISEMAFSNHYMRRILMGRISYEFSVLYNLHNGGLVGPRNHGDFVKYLDVLMYMPGENPAGVWIANLDSIQKMKARMTEGESHGTNCKALISLLGKKTMQRSGDPFAISQRKLQVEKDFNIGKSSAKMTAVSLLATIIELSAFFQEYGRSTAGPAINTVEHCIEACSEAWGIMGLVENSDSGPEAAPVSKQADRLFHCLRKWHKWVGVPLPISKFETRTVEAAKEALQGLTDIGKQMASGGCISSTGYDSKNWKAVTAGNNLYKVCESIKIRTDNIEEMLDVIQSSLADVIGSCVFKVEEIIVDQCSLWAEALMEERLWDSFYEAWRAKGVIQQLRPGIKFQRSIFQFEKIHSF